MSDTISISRPEVLDIHGEGAVSRGGNQDWYATHWQQQAGCGPTNCANLLLYLAKTRAGCAPLCPHDASRQQGFLTLMEAVWKYVTPGHMGLNSTVMFCTGARRYAQTRGVRLSAQVLNIPRMGRPARNYNSVELFLRQILAQDLPVAFLNLSNGTLSNLDSWHWVTLVALRADEGLIFDQGEEKWINLRQWLGSSAMGGGFVALEAT